MLFKFPQKKIVLDCFTAEEYILKTAPIDFAVKHTPEWWKDLPVSYVEGFIDRGTTKRCNGIVDYYKYSLAIPLWTDIAINVKADGNKRQYSWQTSDNATNIVFHDVAKQATGFLSTYGHMKIESPWLLKEKEGINWVWSHPTYNYPSSNDVVCLPGVLSYKDQHSAQFNIMVSLEKEQTILINQGQTMAHLTPMSDRKVEIVRHLVTYEEMNRIRSNQTRITFLGNYRNMQKRKEQFKKCPFHNHLK
jgi:hypothetical protein